MSIELNTCTECGSLIDENYIEKHELWHALMSKVVTVAKANSYGVFAAHRDYTR